MNRPAALAAFTLVIGLGLAACTQSPPPSPEAAESPQTADVAPTASPSTQVPPSPVAGDGFITFTRQVTDLTDEADPWLSSLWAWEGGWLVRVIAGPADDAHSQFIPLDPATGQVLPSADPSLLPEDVYCSQGLLNGALVCAWDSEIHLIDPATGQATPEPLAAVESTQFLGLEVSDGVIVATGLVAGDPVVAAFDDDGAALWSTPVPIADCAMEAPEYRVTITITPTQVQVSFAAFQFAVGLADGKLLVSACGVAVFAADGAMVVGQVYGDEPPPPTTYAAADGAPRPVGQIGRVDQIVTLTAAGQDYVAALDDQDQTLWLVDAVGGQTIWHQDWQYGRLQTWDDANLYLSGRYGLSAVDIATGDIQWTWSGVDGMAVRTAVLTKSAGLVVATSVGVSGVDPATGRELWTVEDPYLAGYYWTPPGLGPEAAKQGDTVVFLGVERVSITRFDPPPMTTLEQS